ncbi:MAG: hypothetical protein E5W82_10500 [Mesorhizobium sp.]|nr:MAG: hypothetical protein E5W82_10500 [Mesorhizobium sp.]
MVSRFVFRRWTANEFKAALADARMTINDFMFVTGRHSEGVSRYLDPNRDDAPTLSEMVLLKLAAKDDATRAEIIEIADAQMVDMGHRKDRR